MRYRFLAFLTLFTVGAIGAAAPVGALGAVADTATIGIFVHLAPPPADYKVTYKGCTLTRENVSDLRAVVSAGAAASVKIQHLKKLPKSTADVAGKVLYLLASTGVERFVVVGNLASFYTDAPVQVLDAGGAVGSISTKNATVARISLAGAAGSIRMAATPGGVNSSLSATRVASGQGAGQPLGIALTGIVLEDLATSQTVSRLTVAAKAFRNKTSGASGVATSGIGRIAPAAVADTSGTYTLAAAAFGTVSTKGADIRPDGLVSQGPVGSITGKALNLGGQAFPAMLGLEAQPLQLLMRAQTFGTISADSGVHGRFWAGFDASGPTYTGTIGTVATKAGVGTLSGELRVAPGSTVMFKPAQGAMQVFTSGTVGP